MNSPRHQSIEPIPSILLDEFLACLKPYQAEVSGGTHYGILAQELEDSAVGAQFILEEDGEKWVNFGAMMPLVLAALSRMDQRLQELEVMLEPGPGKDQYAC